jgi:hypothetical protein
MPKTIQEREEEEKKIEPLYIRLAKRIKRINFISIDSLHYKFIARDV